MIALGVILLLIGLLCIPVGVDVRYDGALAVKLKIGALRFALFPGKQNAAAAGEPKPKREKKRKKTKDAAEPAQKKPKPTLRELLALARIGLNALGRLRRSLSIDVFMLHVCVAAADPYDAVLRYGALNAGLSALSGPLHRALRIRSEDVRTDVNVLDAAGAVEARLVATLQIWEILYTGICAGLAFLSWNSRRKKAAKCEESVQEEKAS